MELYLIRHGQSVNNALGADISKRVKDPPLTDLGQQQAEKVAAYLASGLHTEEIFNRETETAYVEVRRGFGITRLYCSAMHRALQTAYPISQALGLRPQVWADIHEQGGIYLDEADGRRVGYPGFTRAEILADFPDYILTDDVTENGWWTGDHETTEVAQGRAIRVAGRLRGWATSDPDGRIAVVSHATFIRHLIKALLNQLPAPHVFYSHFNTAITHIDLDAEGRVVLRYLNRTDHLPYDMVSA